MIEASKALCKHPPAFLLLLATGAGAAAGRLGLELAAASRALALASSSSTCSSSSSHPSPSPSPHPSPPPAAPPPLPLPAVEPVLECDARPVLEATAGMRPEDDATGPAEALAGLHVYSDAPVLSMRCQACHPAYIHLANCEPGVV
jgi:hypothetical protein